MSEVVSTKIYELRRPDGAVLLHQVVRADTSPDAIVSGDSYWHHIYGEILPPWLLFSSVDGETWELVTQRPVP